MRAAATAPVEPATWRLLDTGLAIYAAIFLAFYATDAVLALGHMVPALRHPVELFCLMAAPLLLRLHWPDYRRNGFAHTLALWRDHRYVLVPFLGLLVLNFATSLAPHANVAYGGGKAIYILVYRFAMFVGALSAALFLVRRGWRGAIVLMLVVLLGSVLYDVAYPGTFSSVVGRAGGFQENPNQAAIALVMIATLSVRYDRVHATDLLLILGAFIGVFVTLSRGGFFQLTLFLLNYLYFTGRGQRLKQLVLVPAIAAVMVLVAGSLISVLVASSDLFVAENAQRRLATFALSNDNVYETDGSRLELIPLYLSLIDRHPFLGYGAGFSRSMPLGPHNSYLDFWINNGYVGLLLYIWLLVALLVLSWRRQFWPGFAFAQIAIVAGFFTHNVIQLPVFLFLAGSAMGISWGLTAAAPQQRRLDRSTPKAALGPRRAVAAT